VTSIQQIHAHVARYAGADAHDVMAGRGYAGCFLPSGHAELRRIKKQGVMLSMKKTPKKQLVLKRDTVKALIELPNTAYRFVVGGCEDAAKTDNAYTCPL
jgi:hypothetical protein